MRAHAKPEQGPVIAPSMKGPLITSAVFHVVLFTLTAIGLPFVTKQDPLTIATPISIEMVEIAKVTQTNRLPEPQTKKPAPEPEQKEPPEKPRPKPRKPETKPKTPTPPPLSSEKEADKEKPEPEKTKPEEEREPARDFQSLLKDLTPQEESPRQEEEEAPAIQTPRLADRLTISELDAFKRQIEPCWNIPAGAKYAENLIVEVRVVMNPDGTVQKASILDKGRYNRDSHFRAAADSALRALRNPGCSPLDLPADKYERWKTIVIRFDPRDML